MIQIDMDMPSKCEDCPIEWSDEYECSHECVLLYKGYTNKVRTFGRLAECPLKGADDYERATEQMEHDMLYEPTYNSEDGSM